MPRLRLRHAIVAALAVAAVPAQATRPGEVAAFGAADPRRPVIPSTAPGALPEPGAWRCDMIAPDYRAWRSNGHDERDWRYAGKAFRIAATGEVYDWKDWKRWARQARCKGLGNTPGPRFWSGAGIWAAGMAVLFTAFGSGPDSPG